VQIRAITEIRIAFRKNRMPASARDAVAATLTLPAPTSGTLHSDSICVKRHISFG
jgi:hypothetical protein